MDFEAEESKFNKSLKELVDSREDIRIHKKVLVSLCQDICDLKSADKTGMPPSVFVLYSSDDHTYKLLLL